MATKQHRRKLIDVDRVGQLLAWDLPEFTGDSLAAWAAEKLPDDLG